MDSILKDIRFALRVLAKSPGFTAVVVLSLALGIGANTALFGIVNAMLLQPMPVDAPDRLAAIYVSSPQERAGTMSYPEMMDLAKAETGASDLIAFAGWTTNITEGDRPEVVWSEITSGNYFSGLGVHPVLGRGFLPEEDRPGAPAVCVISYKLWQRHFQADQNVIGKTLSLNHHTFTVVGVAPKSFIGARLFSFVPDVWFPLQMQKSMALGFDLTDPNARGTHWVSPWVRLKPGVSMKQAETAMNVVMNQLAAEYPKAEKDRTVHLVPGGARTHAGLVALGLVSTTTAIMFAAGILVLLIACSNIANLMLARATSRAREMAIRVAVGATRGRLVRQLITESLLLSLGGAVVGLLLSAWMTDRLKLFYPTLDFQTADLDGQSAFSPQVFLYALLVSLASAVIFGLLPALRASKVDQVSAMKGEQAAAHVGRFHVGSGNLLVMAQVTLSCLLLVVGGLFLRSMEFARNVSIGFDRTGISMFSVNLESQGYNHKKGLEFQQQLVDRLKAVGAVESAAVAFAMPLDAYNEYTPVFAEGYALNSDREENGAGLTPVGPHYFETMGTKIVAGRAIDERDTADSQKVAVVNETAARRYWGSPEKAVGGHFGGKPGSYGVQVVGVSRDGKYDSFGEGAVNHVFVPISQDYSGQVVVLMRSKLDLQALIPIARQQIAELDPQLPIFGIRTMPQFLNRMQSIYDMGASLIGTFAVMAILLAAVGIYGVLHFTVARRTREIGIRMALGAGVGQVLRPVLQRSLTWVAAGLALGLGLAVSARGLTSKLIAGVSGSDPLTILAAIGLFLLIVTVAIVIPARRASKVDPLCALRHE